MSKCDVNGENAHDVYKFIRDKFSFKDEKEEGEIPWNFSTFLLDGEGKILKFYSPKLEPYDMIPEIESILKEKSPNPDSFIKFDHVEEVEKNATYNTIPKYNDYTKAKTWTEMVKMKKEYQEWKDKNKPKFEEVGGKTVDISSFYDVYEPTREGIYDHVYKDEL